MRPRKLLSRRLIDKAAYELMPRGCSPLGKGLQEEKMKLTDSGLHLRF